MLTLLAMRSKRLNALRQGRAQQGCRLGGQAKGRWRRRVTPQIERQTWQQICSARWIVSVGTRVVRASTGSRSRISRGGGGATISMMTTICSVICADLICACSACPVVGVGLLLLSRFL